MAALLAIENLRVEINTARGLITPVNDVSLSIEPGEILGLVGESGSGKSMTAMAITRMLPTRSARISAGNIQFGGHNLVTLPERRLRGLRGKDIGTVFQEPMTALNPVLTIGDQLTEPLRRHLSMSRRAAYIKGHELLEMVGLHDPARVMGDYPFRLSGGMRQRVMIAMAMSCEPQLLIADEPTTALDATTQLQILDLMVGLQRSHGTAVLLITHDLGVVAQTCQRAAVMYGGLIVETGTVEKLFAAPEQDYTRRLLSFLPKNRSAETQKTERESVTVTTQIGAEPILEVTDLVKHYPSRKRSVFAKNATLLKAVDGVSFTVNPGTTLAIVGESGSGKSTIGRAVLRLIEPTSGSIIFQGRELLKLEAAGMRGLRSEMQIIFQDTYASLDPRWLIGRSLAEPLRTHTGVTTAESREKVGEVLELVGLERDHANRFPHEFSGGQRQRIGIARALILKPSLIICDEPVSALDVSVQAQVLELMKDLQNKLNLTYIFISHDLSVVEMMADEVIVMSDGRVVETGTVRELFDSPKHAYTKALLAAIPIADPASRSTLEERRDLVDLGLAAGRAFAKTN